jgi:hypothetical protein
MAVLAAANTVGPPYPAAHDTIPVAYRSFAEIANRGAVVEATGTEREAVMALEIEPVTLNLREDVVNYLKLRSSVSAEVEPSVKQEALRMAMLIIERVKRGGETGVKVNPLRSAPNLSDLNALIVRKWAEQGGRCALCGGALVVGGANKMLQASADRTDSANGAYDDENVAITHLACNLAKNKYGLDEFEDWLAILRGVDR